MEDQARRLVAAGMSVEMAEGLSRDYLNKVAETSNVFSLIEFFSNDRAKKALHAPKTQMDNITLNFMTRKPESFGNIQASLKS